MAQTKEISRRIKSVSNTKKITRAMEMVAAAKMRKAVEAALRTRTYANLSWETVLRLARMEKGEDKTHPLLGARKEIKKAAIVLIASNRGLCGPYNSAVIAKAKELAASLAMPVDFILLGKKGAAVYQSHQVAAEFPKSDVITDAKEIVPVITMLTSDYIAGNYDKIFVAYTDFISAVSQVPSVKQLLPIDLSQHDLGIMSEEDKLGVSQEYLEKKSKSHISDENYSYDFTFEPSPREVLDFVIPKLLEVQLYQAVLEANASEHSAAMAAMHQATEAASDMVKELTLFYNKARQASITAEIAEISAGANALAD